MVNLIGDDVGPTPPVLAVPGAHLHRYGKAPRPGRKVGHVTVVADGEEELAARLAAVAASLSRQPGSTTQASPAGGGSLGSCRGGSRRAGPGPGRCGAWRASASGLWIHA